MATLPTWLRVLGPTLGGHEPQGVLARAVLQAQGVASLSPSGVNHSTRQRATGVHAAATECGSTRHRITCPVAATESMRDLVSPWLAARGMWGGVWSTTRRSVRAISSDNSASFCTSSSGDSAIKTSDTHEIDREGEGRLGASAQEVVDLLGRIGVNPGVPLVRSGAERRTMVHERVPSDTSRQTTAHHDQAGALDDTHGAPFLAMSQRRPTAGTRMQPVNLSKVHTLRELLDMLEPFRKVSDEPGCVTGAAFAVAAATHLHRLRHDPEATAEVRDRLKGSAGGGQSAQQATPRARGLALPGLEAVRRERLGEFAERARASMGILDSKAIARLLNATFLFPEHAQLHRDACTRILSLELASLQDVVMVLQALSQGPLSPSPPPAARARQRPVAALSRAAAEALRRAAERLGEAVVALEARGALDARKDFLDLALVANALGKLAPGHDAAFEAIERAASRHMAAARLHDLPALALVLNAFATSPRLARRVHLALFRAGADAVQALLQEQRPQHQPESCGPTCANAPGRTGRPQRTAGPQRGCTPGMLGLVLNALARANVAFEAHGRRNTDEPLDEDPLGQRSMQLYAREHRRRDREHAHRAITESFRLSVSGKTGPSDAGTAQCGPGHHINGGLIDPALLGVLRVQVLRLAAEHLDHWDLQAVANLLGGFVKFCGDASLDRTLVEALSGVAQHLIVSRDLTLTGLEQETVTGLLNIYRLLGVDDPTLLQCIATAGLFGIEDLQPAEPAAPGADAPLSGMPTRAATEAEKVALMKLYVSLTGIAAKGSDAAHAGLGELEGGSTLSR